MQAQVFLKDMSLSTSGVTRNHSVSGGHRYSHIMDPRRGVPAESAVQVTVIAPRDHRKRSLGKALLHPGRRLDGGAQAEVLACALLRKHSWGRVLVGGVALRLESGSRKLKTDSDHAAEPFEQQA